MKNTIFWFVGLLLTALSFTATGCTTDDERLIKVSIGDKVINSAVLNDDGKVDVFKKAFKSDDLYGTEMVKIGDKVYIDFPEGRPDGLVVKDDLIDGSGNFMYGKETSVVVNCESDGSKYCFVVEKHPASLFISMHDGGRIDFRAFRVRASWAEKVVTYGFVLKIEATSF